MVSLYSGCAGPERNVSLKQVLQHMESSPDVTQYGLCGLRKWSSRGAGTGQRREPFSRTHLHDFLLLNVDLTQDVQYNQNRWVTRTYKIKPGFENLSRFCFH